jgi:hypothetical protein
MKTLDQLDAKLEKRTPLTSSGGQFNITSAGSYYLTKNIAFGGNGIVITADDVTIDLNGFSLLGPGTGTGSGVAVSGAHRNINIVNGTIRGFGAHGISAAAATSMTVERVTVANNGACPNAGILLGNKALVVDCVAIGNCNGIVVGADSVVTKCNGHTNNGTGIISSGAGSVIESCSASNNTVYGIAVTTDSRVNNCSADSNGSRGITAGDGCSISNCVATSNGTYGIYSESDGIVSACTARKQSFGIRVGNNATITGCIANQNTSDGIQTVSGCLVLNNVTAGNGTEASGGAGIHLFGTQNRVDGNHVLSTKGTYNLNNPISIGIRSNGGSGADYVIRNIASGSQLDFSPNTGTTLGPKQQPSNANSPWANLIP